VSIGARVTYFGNLTLTGFGYNGDGINPEVPSDADENVFLPERFNYSGKFSTDIYSNIQLSKKVNFIFGADNIFNVHPDFAVNPQAKYWAGDNETGGPWDGVQMGYNGLRLFTKLAFRF
jgi:iron complex outermembrane receptor protein